MTLPLAVSFDLDETLLDNAFIRETVATCCASIAARLGLAVETVADANAAAFGGYWPEVEARLALGSMTGGEMIREVWRRVLATCGCEDGEVLDDVIAEHLRLDGTNARPFPDVAPVLGALRSAGVPLALITNGSADTQRARLRTLGIEDHFAATVISAEVGAVKPDGAVFRRVADALGVGGADLWHVGDNLATDVAGALAAGHTAVWLNRRGWTRRPGDPVPTLEIRSLAELPLATE